MTARLRAKPSSSTPVPRPAQRAPPPPNRAAAIAAVVDAEQAAIEVTDLVRRGARRAAAIDLPAEAESIRAAIRPEVARLRGLTGEARKQELIETGYVMPHWPKPWGRDASAIEQLVIEQEFTAAGIKRPSLGITSWIILTLIQHASPDQVARWVRPALSQDVIWCQLFSEPGAGSDAAGIRTRATRTEQGWRINGQKVWTSGAHAADFGLATVRTNPDAPKHEGITMMVIDMHAPGVTVRPLKMPSGNSDFNEVFFDDVFVPDADVVGPVDAGWTVARATLGNESVSIGGGDGGRVMPAEAFIAPLDAHPERLAGGAGRVGRRAWKSQRSRTRRRMPTPSEPSTIATRSPASSWANGCGAVSSRPQTQNPAPFNRSSARARLTTRTSGTRSSAPES